MATKKPNKENKLKKCLKAPIKLLTKAKDIYIKGMTQWSDNVASHEVLGVHDLPRSCSTKSSNHEDDYVELLRVASTKSLCNKIELDFLQRQQSQRSPTTTGSNNMPRCHSVHIRTIDEENPFDFGDDPFRFRVEKPNLVPRSRSYAAPRRNTRAF